jgi:SAM-dependent methyltransferase
MDVTYWESFYNKKHSSISKPSSFALFVADYLSNTDFTIIDVGCGNGRDSIFFSKLGFSVFAIDQALDLEYMNSENKSNSNLNFIRKDYTTLDFNGILNSENENLIIYSRFALHSLNKIEEANFFYNLSMLPKKTLFFIEARTINDKLFGQGERVGNNEFIMGHYRRFIDPDILKTQLSDDFNFLYFSESDNLSIFNNENPTLMRVILEKK